jgi:uncharacterized protein YgbK (DUF1537 family)
MMIKLPSLRLIKPHLCSIRKANKLFLRPFADNRADTWLKLQKIVSADRSRVIVLDDDPTGCQTVHDIEVLLDFSVPILQKQLMKDDKLFFILTNSRSLPEPEAVQVTKQAMSNINTALNLTGYKKEVRIISRSDSTLRGHFPAETNAIMATSVQPYKGVVICPVFIEGGRYTLNNIHYLEEKQHLIPVGETVFAKDAHFGYQHSDLTQWAMEKDPSIQAKQIISISLDDVRSLNGEDVVCQKLLHASANAVIIVNG